MESFLLLRFTTCCLQMIVYMIGETKYNYTYCARSETTSASTSISCFVSINIIIIVRSRTAKNKESNSKNNKHNLCGGKMAWRRRIWICNNISYLNFRTLHCTRSWQTTTFWGTCSYTIIECHSWSKFFNCCTCMSLKKTIKQQKMIWMFLLQIRSSFLVCYDCLCRQNLQLQSYTNLVLALVLTKILLRQTMIFLVHLIDKDRKNLTLHFSAFLELINLFYKLENLFMFWALIGVKSNI